MDIEHLKSLACKQIDHYSTVITDLAKEILSNPEVGFYEYQTSKLVKNKLQEFGIPLETELAVTGVKGKLNGKYLGPNIGVIGELDALIVKDHPNSNSQTFSAHACGHHCQIAMMIGCVIGLNQEQILNHLYGSISPFAVPAEEFINIPDRLNLKRQGNITFLGGKQELISLGHFDNIDIAFMCHTATGSTDKMFALGGSSTTHITKIVTFSSGAESSDNLAQNAALFALEALNHNRDIFQSEHTPRSHGIIIPQENFYSETSQSKLEWRIRASDLDSLQIYSKLSDQCFKAAGIGLGCDVIIETIPGYLPMFNDTRLQSIFETNANNLLGNDRVMIMSSVAKTGGSTDMGDLSHLIPVCHPYCTGASGTGHGKDYVIQDYNTAVIYPAKIMAMVAIDLLTNNGEKALDVIRNFDQKLSKAQYLELQNSRFSEESYSNTS